MRNKICSQDHSCDADFSGTNPHMDSSDMLTQVTAGSVCHFGNMAGSLLSCNCSYANRSIEGNSYSCSLREPGLTRQHSGKKVGITFCLGSDRIRRELSNLHSCPSGSAQRTCRRKNVRRLLTHRDTSCTSSRCGKGTVYSAGSFQEEDRLLTVI
jgi:hypothetical protein